MHFFEGRRSFQAGGHSNRKVSMDLLYVRSEMERCTQQQNNEPLKERWMWGLGTSSFPEGSTGGSYPFWDQDLVRD